MSSISKVGSRQAIPQEKGHRAKSVNARLTTAYIRPSPPKGRDLVCRLGQWMKNVISKGKTHGLKFVFYLYTRFMFLKKLLITEVTFKALYYLPSHAIENKSRYLKKYHLMKILTRTFRQ